MRQFKVKQVRELLQYDRDDSVLALIRGGQLPASNISRNPSGRPTWRISEADLNAFLESRRFVPPATHSRRQQRKAQAAAVPDYVG
jgi:hypothetical protein